MVSPVGRTVLVGFVFPAAVILGHIPAYMEKKEHDKSRDSEKKLKQLERKKELAKQALACTQLARGSGRVCPEVL